VVCRNSGNLSIELPIKWAKTEALMPVSGIVVTCVPGHAAEVATAISIFEGVEIHGVLPEGKIVAVIEAETVDAEVGLVSRLHEIKGVVSVQMAYHNFEDI
jgi:nitrate reductase NapD